MTDEETIEWVLTLFEIRPDNWAQIDRNGRILLALPSGRRGALRALRLYQPQRIKARAAMAAVWLAAGLGVHRWLLPALRHHGGVVDVNPQFSRAIPYTTGILLGSPEHRVRRAVASYRTAGGWEVAKIAFGREGAEVLEQEARILEELQAHAKGIPRLLGLHRGEGVTFLRMPYLTGKPITPMQSDEALRLLDQWIADECPKPATGFPEWAAIGSALEEHCAGNQALVRLSQECLRPVIRHGDFARWNLRRHKDGGLVVLDWEWGHKQGMPGIDLVHYFLQDARLVERLSPEHAIARTCQALKSPACRTYLQKTGWSGDPLLPLIACLAFKQGAGHQDNAEMLRAAVAAS